MISEKLRTQSWPECSASSLFKELPVIYVADNGVQTDNITCDHEKENNRRVMNELKVLYQHLLDYNSRSSCTVNQEYNERISANKKLRYEGYGVENLK
jgi:hypothetical protein